MSKAVEAPGTKSQAKIPKAKQTLRDSGSVIHWDEIYKTKVVVKRGRRKCPYTKWLVPVTCGRAVSPQCRGKRDMVVLRGMTGPEPLTPNNLTPKGSTFTGFCSPCLRAVFSNLSDSSEVHLDDKTDEGVLVKCGACKKFRRVPRISEPKKFTGLCRSCGVRGAIGIADHTHPINGARVYSSRPASEGPNKGKWPFGCVGCGKETFAWSHQTKSPKWKALCSDCGVKLGYGPRRGSPPRVTKDESLPLTGAPVFFSRRKGEEGKLVPVKCVYPVLESETKICGVEHYLHFKVLRRNWQNATGFCPKHDLFGRVSRRVVYEAMQALQALALAGGAQKKRSRGRQLGDRVYSPENVRASLESVIRELNETLPEHRITRARIAAEYNKSGEGIDASTVTKRVQMAYGEGVTVADAVAAILKEKRESKSPI